MNRIVLALIACFLVTSLSAQTPTSLLQSGPMLGYADFREVMLWAQTKQPARVQIRYTEQGTTQPFVTAEVLTLKATAYTAKLLADQVQPGKTYTYELLIDGKKVALPYPTTFQTQALWQYRTDPPAFTFGVGSCTYINDIPYDRPGTPYGAGYEIFGAIHAKKPDFMLWTGDNIYLREPDWNTRTGILHRNTHTRSIPEMQPLLASTHNYAIWDDHDFGPNDSDRGFWNKRATEEAFKLFWANPAYIFDEGCTGTFTWNDCQFFMMDDRTWRAPNEAPNDSAKAYYGQKQLTWLIDALTYSKATFKFVVTGGQIVNPAAVFENYAVYAQERERLLTAITNRNIPGVLFITGDRHHTIVHKLERSQTGQSASGGPAQRSSATVPTGTATAKTETYPLYDVTISPLTSGSAKPREEELKQPSYVDGTLVTDRNFATMNVSGPLKDRVLTIRVFDQKGAERWNRTIRAAELQ